MGLCAINDERPGDKPGRFRFHGVQLWLKRCCRVLVWSEPYEIGEIGRAETLVGLQDGETCCPCSWILPAWARVTLVGGC